MKTILVTGGRGQLGSELRVLSEKEKDVKFIFTNSEEMDITSLESINNFFQKSQVLKQSEIIAIINTAAYTQVDQAEIEQELAYKVNAVGAKNLAIKAKELGSKFVHISTDYVFDGNKSYPYREADLKNPISVYGKTKAEGEDLVLEVYPESIIIRSSWVYSSYGKNFLKTIMKLAKEKEKLTVVYDQIGTPTSAKNLAWITYKAALSDQSGIFHYSNEGVASWFDFAHAIVDMFGFNCEVIPIPTENYPTLAKRPFYSVLDKSKFYKAFNIKNPHWRDSLKEIVMEIIKSLK
jgi:dTDP-4-dehydrorhamnose reductase